MCGTDILRVILRILVHGPDLMSASRTHRPIGKPKANRTKACSGGLTRSSR